MSLSYESKYGNKSSIIHPSCHFQSNETYIQGEEIQISQR